MTATRARRAPIYPGWLVVAAAFVVLFVVYSIQFSFGTFVDDVVEDTGWSETRLQLIFAIYIFSYSALSAVSGVLTDRFGPRRVVAAGSIVLTAGYLLWAIAPNLWIAFLGLGVIASVGMSASWVPCNATVVRWFVDKRGTALAITTAGGSIANIVAPPITALLVGAYGWRVALGSLAIVGGTAMFASSFWFQRDPESVGLVPDGFDKSIDETQSNQRTADPVTGMTAPEATRTTTYWLLLIMYALTFLVVFVPFVHVNQFAVGLGIADVTAATVISAIGVGGLAGRLLSGPVSDRIGRKRLAIGAFTIETLAFVGLATATGLAMLYPAAILFGFAYGAGVTMLPALVGDYFGRAHAGAIVGRIFATAGSLAAVGPYVAQLLVDATDSYRVAFSLAALTNAAALIMATRLPNASKSLPLERQGDISLPAARSGDVDEPV